VTWLWAALGALVVLAWFLRRGERTRHRAPSPRADIDWQELEAAEREVRGWDSSVKPDDDAPGADWGPGTGKPRPPELL
jgi:hypothetical protein